MDERALIEAAQTGDAQAFERVLEVNYERIYRFALLWCGDKNSAEDIAQEACIKLARGISQFKFDSAFSSWLYRLVINCAKDWRRAQKIAITDSLDTQAYPEPALASQAHNGEAAVYLQQILTLVEKMGEGIKETVLLVLAEGLSHSEAATILHVQESTISWRIHSVRQKLSLLTNEIGGHR